MEEEHGNVEDGWCGTWN